MTTDTAESQRVTTTDVFAVDPSVKAKRRESIVVIAGQILLGVLTLLVWQLASGRLVSEFWISSPGAVWTALLDQWTEGLLAPAIRVTLLETVLGFGLGASTGIGIGLLLGISPIIARIVDPYLVAANSVPRVALIPLLILWFGIGLETKVIFAALLVFFPVFMNTFAGIRDVDRDLTDVLRVMGASRLDTIRNVLMPSAFVWVFAGLRVSIPFALIGAVIAEMFTSDDGLGYLIAVTANQYDTAGSFAAIFVTTFLGVVLTAAISQVERRVLKWQPNHQ
jgi:NitT/TauT family transport system permease protein